MNTLLLITIILILSIISLKLSKRDNFLDFNDIMLDAKSESNVKNSDVLNNTINILSKGNIPMSNKTVDDSLITNFVKKQLNQDDVIGSGSYDTNNKMLEYPKEQPGESVPSKQIDYDTVISQQNNEIKTISNRQDLTLKNLKYELLRLIELNKTIPEIESDLKPKSKKNSKSNL